MANKQISWSEVRKHATKDDAWIVVDGKVYDVTNYMDEHPGGPQWILDWLGKDATQAFADKGGMGLEHSDAAKASMADLLIGEIEQ